MRYLKAILAGSAAFLLACMGIIALVAVANVAVDSKTGSGIYVIALWKPLLVAAVAFIIAFVLMMRRGVSR